MEMSKEYGNIIREIQHATSSARLLFIFLEKINERANDGDLTFFTSKELAKIASEIRSRSKDLKKYAANLDRLNQTEK